MNSEYLKDGKPCVRKLEVWMKSASDRALADFLHNEIEPMEDCPLKSELKAAFDRESDMRSSRYYENLNGGEWL